MHDRKLNGCRQRLLFARQLIPRKCSLCSQGNNDVDHDDKILIMMMMMTMMMMMMIIMMMMGIIMMMMKMMMITIHIDMNFTSTRIV